MAIVSPLFVASVASLTLAMTTIGATINLLQQMKILPFSGTCSSCNSPSSLVTHIEALLSTGIRLQTHKDSSCRYTRPGLQASLYCLQPA